MNHNSSFINHRGHIVQTMQEPAIREPLFRAPDTDAVWAVFARVFASQQIVRTPRK